MPVFKNTISLGSILSVVAWGALLIAGWTNLKDRVDVVEAQQIEEKKAQAELAQTMANVQQITAAQTAVLTSLEERLRRDEQQLDNISPRH